MIIHVWDGNPKLIGTVKSSWPKVIYVKSKKNKVRSNKKEIQIKTLEIFSKAKALALAAKGTTEKGKS